MTEFPYSEKEFIVPKKNLIYHDTIQYLIKIFNIENEIKVEQKNSKFNKN